MVKSFVTGVAVLFMFLSSGAPVYAQWYWPFSTATPTPYPAPAATYYPTTVNDYTPVQTIQPTTGYTYPQNNPTVVGNSYTYAKELPITGPEEFIPIVMMLLIVGLLLTKYDVSKSAHHISSLYIFEQRQMRKHI
jgi:hypothetical protein